MAHEARTLFAGMTRSDDGNIDDPYDDAKVIARCVRDDEGKQIFSEKHLPRIAAMGNDVVLALVNECLAINGMGKAGREAIEKNSKALGSDS
jgi:hypothetical protein